MCLCVCPPAGGTISLAAACGGHLVVACGSSLTCFSISCCQGTLEVTATTDLQQQASALGMFTLQGVMGAPAGVFRELGSLLGCKIPDPGRCNRGPTSLVP